PRTRPAPPMPPASPAKPSAGASLASPPPAPPMRVPAARAQAPASWVSAPEAQLQLYPLAWQAWQVREVRTAAKRSRRLPPVAIGRPEVPAAGHPQRKHRERPAPSLLTKFLEVERLARQDHRC